MARVERAAFIAVAIGLVGIAGAGVLRSTVPQQPAMPAPIEKIVVNPEDKGARLSYPAGNTPQLVLPDGQRRMVRSILNVKDQMHFGDFVWNETGVPQGPVWVRVDLGHQLLSVFRAGHEIGSAVIIYGADIKETPAGVFPVLQKAKDYHSVTYDAPMPYMLRLTKDGVAIHASNVQQGAATHGCIGVPEEFARLLFTRVKMGDQVAIFAAG